MLTQFSDFHPTWIGKRPGMRMVTTNIA